MANFFISYGKAMSHEGSYSNDPRDGGGETWKGITRRFYPEWEGWEIIDREKVISPIHELNANLNNNDLLEDLVLRFYESEYWEQLLLSRIREQDIADEVFDTAVNQGLGTSGKYFQKALNLLNNNQKYYSDLVVDGQIGNKTIKAYRAYMLTANFRSRSTQRNINTLLKAVNFFQTKRYIDICEKNPGQEVYFYGWLNRV